MHRVRGDTNTANKFSNKKSKKMLNKLFEIETYAYAGQMLVGFHELLIGVVVENGIAQAIKSSIHYSNYRPGKQNDCSMSVSATFALVKKGKNISLLGEMPENISAFVGETYEIKEFIKGNGFRWNSTEKNWIK